jgi:hypothetical protein
MYCNTGASIISVTELNGNVISSDYMHTISINTFIGYTNSNATGQYAAGIFGENPYKVRFKDINLDNIYIERLVPNIDCTGIILDTDYGIKLNNVTIKNFGRALHIESSNNIMVSNFWSVFNNKNTANGYGIKFYDNSYNLFLQNFWIGTVNQGIVLDGGAYVTINSGALDNTITPVSIVSTPTQLIFKDVIGYIISGEVRTTSGSLVAGNTSVIAFAWHNPEAQDIFVKKVVIEVTTGGGTVGSHLDVGIADDAIGTNRGIEFLNDLLLNSVQINDSWVVGDGGTQTKWVFCQDSASGTDGWLVGQILDANAASLVGKYYIEYEGR